MRTIEITKYAKALLKYAKALLERILQVFSTVAQLQVTIFVFGLILANPSLDLTHDGTESISFLDLKM